MLRAATPSTRRRARRPRVFAVAFFTGLAVLGVATGAGAAHGSGSGQSRAQAETLTQAFLASNVGYRVAGPSQKGQRLGQLIAAATARQQFLTTLIEDDPAEVLRVAVPATLRAGLPPAVQALVEAKVQIEGDLEVLHEDHPTGSRFFYFLQTASEHLTLHFAAHPPDLETGTRVRVTGVRLGTALALSGSGSVEPLVTVVPNSFGAQKTIVILVNFQDKATEPYTPSVAQSVMATTSNFYWENSYQQAWLTGVVNPAAAADVYGWFTIPLASTSCSTSSIAKYAKDAAQAAGANLAAYTRFVYAFPQISACAWWGAAYVGGNPSQGWINGSFALKVVGHEMGHGLGLYHSHSQSCDSTGCTVSEYGDGWDIMGNPSSGHFTAFQKERLGWLDYGSSPPITTAQAEGPYWLEPYEPAGAGPKALAVLKATDPATGRRTWYYLEYRQKLGFDGSLTSGVLVHTGAESSANTSYLFDLAPTTSTFDGLLNPGQGYQDGAAGVTLTTLSADSTGATVQVSAGPLACVPGAPTVALSPSQSQWVPAGTPVTYTVSVTSHDSAGCAAASFALQAAVPAGWGAVFGVPALTLAPGGSGSTTLQVTSPPGTADGFYTVGVTATSSGDPTDTGSASATYVVVASLDVAAWSDKAAYARNEQVTVTATVSADGAPVSGASVRFTITKASGAVVTGNATTGASGAAVFKYRLKRNDPVGPYQAGASATLNGALTGAAATSFMVQ